MTVGGDKVSFTSDDAVTLMVNGVPVYVNPTPLKDEVADHDFKEKMRVGPDEVQFSEKVTLQINGKPVLVEPTLF